MADESSDIPVLNNKVDVSWQFYMSKSVDSIERIQTLVDRMTLSIQQHREKRMVHDYLNKEKKAEPFKGDGIFFSKEMRNRFAGWLVGTAVMFFILGSIFG